MKKFFSILPFLVFFFGLSYADQDMSVGTGTGFFVSKDGVIITCDHVIEGASRITVKIDGVEHPAQVLAKNTSMDLAVLKINYKPRFHFGIANFNTTTSLGDKVYVLGFPLSSFLGTDIRLTDGVISAKSGIEGNPIYFQISAPIQPGNSGGPILSANFNVIGAAAHKLSDMAALAASGQIPQNVNFGVKSDYIKTLLGNIRHGKGNFKSVKDTERATVQIIAHTRAQQAGSVVRVVNKTGYTVHYAYLSPSDDDSWGPDRLGAGVLMNGQPVTKPIGSAGQYDIRLVNEDGNSYTKMNVRLSPNQTVEFTISDIDEGTQSAPSSTPPGTAAPSGGQASIRITNKTGYMIHYVQVSPSDSTTWGADRLGDDEVLPNGQSISVRLSRPLNVMNTYDIRLIDSDGDTYSKMNVRLSQNQNIEFTIGDIDGGTQSAPSSPSPGPAAPASGASIRIANKTGYLVHHVRLSPAADDKWGPDMLGADEMLQNGRLVTIALPHPLNVTNRYDIQLIDSDGDTYTKWNVLVTQNGVVEFVIGDIDGD
jgi:S1-C subfamily serine protease